MTRLGRIVFVVLCVFGRASMADAAWTRLETTNFVLIGDAPERDIRAAADHLEAFHETLASVLPDSVGHPGRTVVVVFGSDRSFDPYRPQFQGRPIEVAGFFQSFGDRSYMALGPGEGDRLYRVVYHEYAHYITRNSVGAVPVWASEGLAGLYETFEMADSRTVKIGVPSADYLRLLRTSPPMPLRELFSVDHSSPVYNEGSRRGIFYAQSWALIHYLTFNDARQGQLRRYLSADSKGLPADVAFSNAFGDVTALEAELRAYIRNLSFRVLQVKFGDRIAASRGQARPLDDAEADGYLGELLSPERAAEARALFERALASRVDAVMPAIGLARLSLREGNFGEAIGLVEPIAAQAPDNFDAQMTLARALLMQVEQQGASPAAFDRLRTILSRAVSLEPDAPEPAGMFGYVELRARGDVSKAVSLLERAVTLAPAREEYQRLLAQARLLARASTPR